MKGRLSLVCGPLVALSLSASGCEPSCVQDLDLACTPVAQDTSWSNVYSVVVADNCTSGGGSCHSAAGAQGGLVLEGEQEAYDALHGAGGEAAYVVAGDAACSTLTSRLESSRASEVMPPGAQLSEAQRCMVRLWIEEGASR